MAKKDIEKWFKEFRRLANNFDIYGSGCAAGFDIMNKSDNNDETNLWNNIVEHTLIIEQHIDAILALEEEYYERNA